MGGWRKEDTLTLNLTFTLEDSKKIRAWAAQEDFQDIRTAVRALILGGIDIYPTLGIVAAERKANLNLFRKMMLERMSVELQKMSKELADEVAMLEATNAYKT